MAISLSINSTNHLYISIEPTKPVYGTVCSSKTLFSRDCVPRPPQKGDLTNLFYALNIIRLRIGKFPDVHFRQHRKIEYVASLARKILTKEDASSHYVYAAIEKIQLFLNKLISDTLKPLDTSKLTPIELLEHLVYKGLYQMDFSIWHPSEPPSSLIESLRVNGPIILNTTLKTPGYEHSLSIHKIVIVGVKILTAHESLVYFLDPIDGGHTVYATTYEALSSRTIHIPKSTETSLEEGLEQAYYGWQNPI